MKDKVLKGVDWLNKHIPDWKSKVNKDTLDLRVWRSCILGQIVGLNGMYDYLDLFEKVEIGNNLQANIPVYGFVAFTEEENIVLIQEWKQQL